MKMRKSMMLIAIVAVVFCPHDAEAKKLHQPRPHKTHQTTQRHAAPSVERGAAYSDIVIDATTGRIIHEVDAGELRHPASLTKMMTLYLAFQALDSGRLSLGQYLPVSQNASYQSPSKLGLRAGQRIRVDDAIRGIVTESANDAAVVMGEALGGSEAGFADMMTRQAYALGMSRTRFRNPSGLPDPSQVTTARDMAVLGAALINHYPKFYPYFSTESFTYAGINHHTHNHLMDRYEGMDGIKTGYIRASGFNLVSSVKRGNTRLIGVVFGGRSAVSRDNSMAQLLDQSFASVETQYRRATPVSGEAETADNSIGGGVALPAKVAAIFPPLGASVAKPAAQAQQVARRPAAAQARAGGGAWGVQIGAYSNASIGQQALASLTSSLSNLPADADPQVQKVSAGGTTMYRARLLSLDRQTAQNICSYLVQRRKSCLTVEQ